MLPVDKGVLDDASVAANGRFRLTATLRHETATVRVNIWDFAGILTVGTPELLELWSGCGSEVSRQDVPGLPSLCKLLEPLLSFLV